MTANSLRVSVCLCYDISCSLCEKLPKGMIEFANALQMIAWGLCRSAASERAEFLTQSIRNSFVMGCQYLWPIGREVDNDGIDGI